MREYKKKDRVYIHWEKTPFAKTALHYSLKSVGVVKSIFKVSDWKGDSKNVVVVTGHDPQNKIKQIMLYEHEISLYVGKVSEGDLL